MYEPRVSYHGDEYLYGAISSLGQTAQKALKEYEEAKRQQMVGDMTMELGSKIKNPATGEPYVSPDELNKYTRAGHTQKQSFVTAKLGLLAQQLAGQKAADEHDVAQAHADYYRNRAVPEAKRLVLSPQEISTGTRAGKLPLPTSEHSFQWVDDPENPVNQGGDSSTPIDRFGKPVDPNNPKAEAVGLRQSNGVVKFYPRPTTVQELRQAGIIKSPNDTQPTPTPTPASVKVMTQADFDALPSGTVFIAPDGSKRRKP
jgi:hypothetical protein